MEKSRSWSSAHDWKSCIPHKGIKGSNPFFSATKMSRQQAGLFLWRRDGIRIMSESPGGAFVSQCKHWRTHLFSFRHREKRMQANPFFVVKIRFSPPLAGCFCMRIQRQPLISPPAANNEALAAGLQNRPAPVPAASFRWPYARPENPSAPSGRYRQTSRRHNTIYSTPH